MSLTVCFFGFVLFLQSNLAALDSQPSSQVDPVFDPRVGVKITVNYSMLPDKGLKIIFDYPKITHKL